MGRLRHSLRMNPRAFVVRPNLPEKLAPLEELATNLWFSWSPQARALFMRLNADLWIKSYQNPVWMLGALRPEELRKAETDPSFLAEMNAAHRDLKQYLAAPSWFQRQCPQERPLVAYFSCEFGIEESLPIYSGGLGLLAGDHLKSASDLGLPLVGVGLLYQQGYFHQALTHDGWQQERYPDNDWYNMPVRIETGADRRPVRITVDLAGETVAVQVWSARVGRVPLYLLDTNLPENPPHQRAVTGRLYGGDRDMRIRQEIVLGVGGVRALEALGLRPTVHHMNEGHSAFLVLERIRRLMESERLSFAEAREVVWASSVFTTHTPVPAGNEKFEFDLVRHYLSRLQEQLGLGWTEFAALGQESPGQSPHFNMTVLALKSAASCNGVSKLHGLVSRKMWQVLWPALPEAEIPVGSVTNGVHARSWISRELWDLLVKHLGKNFADDPSQAQAWDKVDGIPDEELWQVREIRGQKLVRLVRRRIEEQMRRRGADVTELRRAEEMLDPAALTFGFARRFATYKRGDLIFTDPDRLHRILTQSGRPVQIVLAGKAHPQDTQGKELIKRLVNFARNDARFVGRVVFVEDYDINVARYLVQGVDVWLNNPRRPLEASGTSGMKAAINMTMNLSFLDGWWDEAYTPDAGWAIGEAAETEGEAERDRIEAQAIYNLIEREIAPKFYDRDDMGLPRKWIAMMKSALKKLAPVFNTHRMVAEYTERMYLPAHRAGARLSARGAAPAKSLAAWRGRIARDWHAVRICVEAMGADKEVKAGDRVPVSARVHLGDLKPSDVSVELYHGELDGAAGTLTGAAVEMTTDHARGPEFVYRADMVCPRSGQHGWTVRVLPRHPDLVHPHTPPFLTWAD